MAGATRSEIIARVQLRLPPRQAESTIPGRTPNLEELVLRGLRLLAERAIKDPEIAKRLTKSASVTFDSNGELSIDDGSVSDLLVEALESAVLTLTGFREPADYLWSFFDFLNTVPHPEIPTWSIYDGKIHVKSGDEDITVNAITGTLHEAIFVPVLDEPTSAGTTLHTQLEDLLVDMVVALYKQALGAPEAAPDEG